MQAPAPSHSNKATVRRPRSCTQATTLSVPLAHSHRRSSAQAKRSCILRPISLAAAHGRPTDTRMATRACTQACRPSTCLATNPTAPRRTPTHPPCLDAPSLHHPARRAPLRRVRPLVLHHSDRTSTLRCAMEKRSSIQESFQASGRRQRWEPWRPPFDLLCHQVSGHTASQQVLASRHTRRSWHNHP